MLNRFIKIIEITSGMTKDKKHVWVSFKFKYLKRKLDESGYTYTYWHKL